MFEMLLLISLTIFTIHYVYFITRVQFGLFALRRVKQSSIIPDVTIVVAARNEEKSIEQCLLSLTQQTYPAKKYEIIIVDDGSTDNTASIVQMFAEQFKNVFLIQTHSNTDVISGSKPLAILQGINQANGEIILTTDADCIVPPRWIESMAKYFCKGVVFVAGPVAEQSTNSFFGKLEQLELLGLISTAAGLIGSNNPIICNGANLAYRKDAFFAAEGFGKGNNDDEVLLNRIVSRKIGKVTFAFESDAVVVTQSANSISSFLKQRIRWANKRGHYEDKFILVTLVALYLFFLNILIVALLIPQNQQILIPFSIVFVGKVIIEYLVLRSGAIIFKQNIPPLHFLIAELLHTPYIVFAAAIGQIASLRWKGRKI